MNCSLLQLHEKIYNMSGFIYLGLFNLQGVHVFNKTTGIELVCLFAVNSTALGCSLAFECVQDQSMKCDYEVIRNYSASVLNASKLVHGCQPSCSLYNLNAKDIFSDGNKDSMVAVTLKNLFVPYLKSAVIYFPATGI